jgi:hypothetical protein
MEIVRGYLNPFSVKSDEEQFCDWQAERNAGQGPSRVFNLMAAPTH